LKNEACLQLCFRYFRSNAASELRLVICFIRVLHLDSKIWQRSGWAENGWIVKANEIVNVNEGKLMQMRCEKVSCSFK